MKVFFNSIYFICLFVCICLAINYWVRLFIFQARVFNCILNTSAEHFEHITWGEVWFYWL